MNNTRTTPAPAVGGRQVDQLLAGRYRLAMSKGGDEVAEVWHALDESTQKVVTLEILRDPGNDAAKQRFLAEARRMAAIERPSVMRVATIRDDGADTFIVFEHLIPLPVVLSGLTAVARDVRPATKAAEETTPTAVAGPTRAVAEEIAVTEEAAPPIVDGDDVPEPSAPQFVAATPARLAFGLTRLAADARGFIRDVMHDAGMDTLVADLRSFIVDARARLAQRSETSPVTPLVSRATALMRRGSAVAAQLKYMTAQTGAPRPKVALPDVTLPNVRLPNVSRVSAGAAALVARVRGNRLVLGGAALIVLTLLAIASPLGDGIGSALRGRPAPTATASPLAPLVPAPFALPPLSAYGATFESQGPYPTTTPNGIVEWVVALRNTGSAGWYRGIDGAQAALMTTDGAGVAVQSTDYVAPGQVGWFVVRFKARAELGTYTVHLLPRIDGRGLMPELGIFTVVTVARNP